MNLILYNTTEFCIQKLTKLPVNRKNFHSQFELNCDIVTDAR